MATKELLEMMEKVAQTRSQLEEEGTISWDGVWTARHF